MLRRSEMGAGERWGEGGGEEREVVARSILSMQLASSVNDWIIAVIHNVQTNPVHIHCAKAFDGFVTTIFYINQRILAAMLSCKSSIQGEGGRISSVSPQSY